MRNVSLCSVYSFLVSHHYVKIHETSETAIDFLASYFMKPISNLFQLGIIAALVYWKWFSKKST